METNRRRFSTLATSAAGALAASPAAQAATQDATTSALGVDATHLGLHPGSPDDQSRTLQRAIDECARTSTPLALPPGVYRVGGLRLSSGAQLIGSRGATRLVSTQETPLLSASGAVGVTLAGLVLDGSPRPLPQGRGLVELEACRSIRVTDCEIKGARGSGLIGVGASGEVSGTAFIDIADAAVHVLDSAGLLIARNRIDGAGNNGIQVWRSHPGDDGTIVIDNRIENVASRGGGSGQNGNAINVFRAGNVIVRGNRVSRCAFSAVRGNAASNIAIEGNSISDMGEVALYAEFGFEGAVIANNSVDGAALGIAVTNFNVGGRLAVVQGNLVRNLLPRRPPGTDPGDAAGVGISVEADTVVTGNVVENAPAAGIMLGWGHHLRDVAVTGNVVRKADIGIAVSVAPGAGTALIANNVIAETVRGAIIGTSRGVAVTGDLSRTGAAQYAHITLGANRVR
jgi:uncharacterized secreted repeat protein (TIGR03808 family)